MFSARRKGSNPRGTGRGVGADVGMDVGVDVGRHINGGAKWPKNQWVMAIWDSE